MREARIILPVADNEGVALAALHTDLKRHVCEAFGGYTATPSQGGWLDRHGNLYEEPGVAYDIACEDGFASQHKLRSIAQFLAFTGRQLAIYLRMPNGEVEFIEPPAMAVAA